ncbi:tetraacyldisaccharide 4'-kinase [Aeoliella sp.]|uniref:tetraacyldisaccharide 4'-kinase n=1 Tax=Aeoliella sp. TaxID=2795800 RepID=UPI003CCBCFBF
MLEPSDFYDLVSGRKRGVVATGMRVGLRAAEVLYATGVQFRNRRYDAQRAEITKVAAPVVSVGNLTLGGTGKTPMVKWIARHLRARDLRVAILSRGYGAEEGAKNDEALELEQSLPDVPHLQSPDRVAIATAAIEELESQVLVLDDGFQHRRLARDLDIVLLDATQPFGFDHVFPRGTLREPAKNLHRAGVVCLSRANLATDAERAAIRQRANKLAPDAAWCEVAHAPATLLNSSGSEQPLDTLRGAKVFGFCGIGNPGAFRKTLEAAGADIVGWRELADHHNYTADDVHQLAAAATESGAKMAICTQKDMVKLRAPMLGAVPLWSVVVEIEFLEGEDAMVAALAKLPIAAE